jgi:hypothetical protein
MEQRRPPLATTREELFFARSARKMRPPSRLPDSPPSCYLVLVLALVLALGDAMQTRHHAMR